jgi:thioredoxin reductase
MSVHQALLFRQWSDDVTYVVHTVPPDAEQAEQLAARGVRVLDGQVDRVEGDRSGLEGLTLLDGRLVEAQTVVVAPRMVARAGFLADLGLTPVQHPSGVGEHVPADPTGRTAVPGVWVAGNVTDLTAQVGAAAAAGAVAGAQINADLVDEETRAAVAELRAVRAASEVSTGA